MKFVEWKHFAIFISLLLITLTRTYEETVPRTVKSILSKELKTHAFKNKKQKISEHSSDVLNAIVLQTVDYAGSSTNIQNNHRVGNSFFKISRYKPKLAKIGCSLPTKCSHAQEKTLFYLLLGITPMRPKLLGMH